MAQSIQISEREQVILHAVVHTYITTAEPVGSRAIVKRFGLNWSPATVRNTMADLEDAGYLQQLHTSSGRIPTSLGYRYYVNCLMRVQELTLSERSQISAELSRRLDDADEVLRQTSHLLALVSHHAGIVETPGTAGAEIRHIEIMPVSGMRYAFFLADSYGQIRTNMISMPEPIDNHGIQRLRVFLNDTLRGLTLEEARPHLENRLSDIEMEQENMCWQAKLLLPVLSVESSSRFYLEGATQLFEQPEFQNMDKARDVFNLLERHERIGSLMHAVSEDEKGSGACVVIGDEADCTGFGEISVVASPYHVHDKQVGMLGIIGPRRMPYPKITALVSYTAKLLSGFLTRLAG